MLWAYGKLRWSFERIRDAVECWPGCLVVRLGRMGTDDGGCGGGWRSCLVSFTIEVEGMCASVSVGWRGRALGQVGNCEKMGACEF